MAKKPVSIRDAKVQIRNKILGKIRNGIEALNRGNREELSNTLKYINNKYRSGYIVDTKPSSTHEFFGDTYTAEDGLIVIKEGDEEIIAIVKLKSGKCMGEYRDYKIDLYNFQYDADIKAEHEAEMEGERAMNEWALGHQWHPSFLDPRGQ